MPLLPNPSGLAGLALCAGVGVLTACANPLDDLDPFDNGEPLPEKRGSDIPYTALVFGEVVVPKKTGGGWQSMCIHLDFERHVDDVSEGRSSRFMCSMQIEFPIVLRDGTRISKRRAKESAASSLNAAISKLDTQGPTASVCGRLRSEIRKLAKEAVPGARVNKNCGGYAGKEVPEVSWP